ncbi:MAG: hypothetical protein AAB037_02420 [Chloroflexota bacterium]
MKKTQAKPNLVPKEAPKDLDEFIAAINKKPEEHHGTKIRFNWTSRKRK